MSEKKWNGMTADEVAEKCAQLAGEYFKVGLNCSESVFKAWMDLGLSDFAPEIVALSSGFGGGMGRSRHTCGAVNAGMLVIGTMKGRKNPLQAPTFEERVQELNEPDTGVYDRHGAYVREVITEWGTIECRDLCFPYVDFDCIERRRNCKHIIEFCAKAAVKAALAD